MTTTDRTGADTATFEAEMDRLDRLEVADESAVERVARAIWAVDHEHLQEFMTGPEIDGFWAGVKSHPESAKRARAAIAALKPALGTDSSGQVVVDVLRGGEHVATLGIVSGSVDSSGQDEREPRACPKCGLVCKHDGWGHIHPSGIGIGSCGRSGEKT